MIFQYSSHRTFLRDTLAERIGRNSAYSLRGFAKSLEVSPALLSQVINGKRNLSFHCSLKVARKLGLGPSETEYFCLLSQFESETDPEARASITDRLNLLNPQRKTTDLSIDVFTAISEWYHIPILVMTDLPPEEFAPRRIARRLGITEVEVVSAIDRLERLGLLENLNGRYKRVHDNPIFSSQTASQALRHFHRQMLGRAIQSLEQQTPLQKYVGSETFAFDINGLRQFERMAEEFFAKTIALARGQKRKHAVYHLGMQLFEIRGDIKAEPVAGRERQ